MTINGASNFRRSFAEGTFKVIVNNDEISLIVAKGVIGIIIRCIYDNFSS